MKGKFLAVILAGVAAAGLAFGLAACSRGESNNEIVDVPGNVEDFDVSGPPDYVGGSTQNSGLLFEQNADGSYTVMGFDPEAEAKPDLTVPSAYNGGAVTAIAEGAFSGCTDIVSVSIANSVTQIGNNAFAACLGLKSVRIPAAVQTLGQGAFRNCSGLRAVIFAEGSALQTIGGSAFNGCTQLTKFTVPDSVKTIEAQAFSGCSSLQSFSSSAVEELGERAFANCTALIDVNLGTALKNVGASAFAECSALKQIVLPDSVISFGLNVLLHCTSLEKLTIPFVGASRELALLDPPEVQPEVQPEEGGETEDDGGVDEQTEKTHLGYLFGAPTFSGNDQMNGDYVPKTLEYVRVTGGEKIAAYAFAYCYNLKTIILADSIEVLDNDAFGQCMNVQTLVLGSGLREIREALFGLRTYSATDPETLPLNIYYTGTAESWNDIVIDETRPTPLFMPNALIIDAVKFYYSETEQDAQHWRYVDGMPKVYDN